MRLLVAPARLARGEDTAETQAPITEGLPDTTHTAVVALTGPDPATLICSGTIVQVTGNVGYVLTAAHCRNKPRNLPRFVVMGSSVHGSINFFPPSNGVLRQPRFGVGARPHLHRHCVQDDFCMLRFQAPPGTPVIPVALFGQDTALESDVFVEYVGFGLTDALTSGQRRHVSAFVTPRFVSDDLHQL